MVFGLLFDEEQVRHEGVVDNWRNVVDMGGTIVREDSMAHGRRGRPVVDMHESNLGGRRMLGVVVPRIDRYTALGAR